MTPAARITVGIPVFRGVEVVADALESVAAQRHGALRVIVSVDGNDAESASVCRRYERDPRFHVVVQPERLGWAGNINWLMHQTSTEFFGYLGQDDRLDPWCYEILLAEAVAHPDAAVVAPHIRWFGGKQGIQSEAEVHGTPFERTVTAIENGVWFPFLGLRRMSVVSAAGDLLVDDDDSHMEDVNWVLKALQAGPVRHVPLPLYHKRAHGGMVSMGKKSWRPERVRRIWIQAWARQLITALATAHEPDEARRLLRIVIERMAVSAPDIDWFYKLDELSRSDREALVADFVALVLEIAPRTLFDMLGGTADTARRQIAQRTPSILGFWGADSEVLQPALGRCRTLLDRDIAAGGWHAREEHPVHGPFRWTGPGTVSEFPLNVLLDRPYRIRVHVPMMMPGIEPGTIELLEDGAPIAAEPRNNGGAGYLIEATVRPAADKAPARELRLALRLPRTFRSRDLGINDDARELGCAVNWIEIEPCE